MSFIVKAHTSIIGDTGYNCHSRNFFKSLDELVPVQVRNYTIGDTWGGYHNDEPHNEEYYMDDQLKKMLVEQTLYTADGSAEFPLYQSHPNTGDPKVHIVLNDNVHRYFWEDYDGIKIAYNVWETTRQPEEFFEQLKKFDQVWVPTKWQRDCTIEQGIPAERVKIVPEGVDVQMYKPINRIISNPVGRPFRFIVVGRWEYRKSTLEITKAFTETFSEKENVELLLLVDNPFATDGMSSTEERLEKFGIKHSGIKIIHHVSKDEYSQLLKTADVFVSCARSEGWNLPLIEAMSSGVPSIYSNWGGQLEFAQGKGIPVDIDSEIFANTHRDSSYEWSNTVPGLIAEPNFDHLSEVMLDVYKNFTVYKKKALDESDDIRKQFTWKNAATIAYNELQELLKSKEKSEKVYSVIITRADNQRKKDLLKQCISSLKTKVIVSTNYPVDEEIQSMVDFVVYSKDNPLLLRDEFKTYGVDYYRWFMDENGNRVDLQYEYEHGYAAYLLTRRGLEHAKLLGADKVHVINYDYEISQETLQENEGRLDSADIIFYAHGEFDFGEKADSYCSAFISAKIDPLLSYFTTYENKHEYYSSMRGTNLLELNIAKYFKTSSYRIVEIPFDNLRISNKVDQESADNMTKPEFKNLESSSQNNRIKINFVDGAFVEITGEKKSEYVVQFIDDETNDIVYSTTIQNNQWARCNRRWFVNWKIKIQSKSGPSYEYKLDLKGKRVFIVFESSSLGDTLAWIPYVEEFRKKHECELIVSTFQNEMFKSEYPNIEFVNPGSSVSNLSCLYRLGCFYDGNGIDFNSHKSDFRKLRLQEYATDILGLEFKEIRPRIKPIEPVVLERPYICIANHSTAQPKYWNNPTGWQELVDYVKSLGYDVYLLSREDDGYMGNKNPSGVIKVENMSLEEIGSILLGSKGFIGLGSGLSWYAWGLGVPTILISGFSEPYQEMSDGIYRIINTDVCTGCFARHLFDRGDWNWCPDHNGTDRQFECTKEITFEMVKPSLDKMLEI